jgi:FAD/FMN-containing dehydrogenase/Fe-S oxidoreductase
MQNGKTRELEGELRRRVKGDVRFDPFTRALYSTDASIFQIPPIGVVFPKDEEDVAAAMAVAREAGVPILPRGGGTSLAGQAVGHAIHIDCSRHMNRLLEVNAEARWARVQPGMVVDELNALLKPHRLKFAVDVSPSNRATLGGNVGTNASGAHSVLYGKTIDHVLEVTALLPNGERVVAREVDEGGYRAVAAQGTLEGEIYRTLRRLGADHRDEIGRRFPKILRRVGGYNLDAFVPGRPFNLAHMLIGSEGTLAATLEAKIKVVPVPPLVGLCILHFHDLIESLESTPAILECRPCAVELVDRMMLDLTKQAGGMARSMDFVEGNPEALLMVEFYGETPEELEGALDRLIAHVKPKIPAYHYWRSTDQAALSKIWKVRKAGVGILQASRADAKAIAFVEDTAVPPARLAEYIRRFRQIIAEHGTTASFYAHASVGLLHIRPVINLKDGAEVRKMLAISEQVRDLVLEYGGAISGEHGDGLSRSCWNEKMFGPILYKAFQEVKATFDPHGMMNPGKVVNAQPMTENLRYGEKYRVALQVRTHFDFSREGGFDRAIEQCNGQGDCRKILEGTMCPSYMVTRDEEHSTRGRANALRAVLSGGLPPEEFTSHRMYKVMDLCLECKGCKAECPSNVDLAKLKYEFLTHYYARHGLPLRNRLFGHIARLSRMGCAMAALANWAQGLGLSKWLLEKLAGVDRRRALPSFAAEPFDAWFARRRNGQASGRPPAPYGPVVLFHDTFLTYNFPEIGRAAVRLLEAAGYEPLLVRRECCGRPMISKGMVERARANARINVERLAPYAAKGIPIVGFEPSCILTFRDEYPDLLPGPEVLAVAASSFLFDEFIAQAREAGRFDARFGEGPRKILLHGHCHQKAAAGVEPSLAALKLIPGATVEVVDSGCCGMAGSFGYEKEHFEISMAIGARRLFPAVKAQSQDAVIAAAGVSCRAQIAQGTGRKALHPVEILAAALAEPSGPSSERG